MAFCLPIIKRLTVLAAASLVLAGCGAKSGLALGSADVSVQSVGGHAIAQFGLGHEGGTQPALLETAKGTWMLVYAGSNSGDLHLYCTTSHDGKTWSTAQEIGQAAYSDQSPALVEDASGAVQLFFASNRDGNDFALYHMTYQQGAWSKPAAVDGFPSVQNLSVTLRNGQYMIAAEELGNGLVASTSKDGTNWQPSSLIAAAGFEPSLTTLSDGTAVVAYRRSNQIYVRSEKSGGSWSTEKSVATATELREPAIAFSGQKGLLIYASRSDMSEPYKLSALNFDASLVFTPGSALPVTDGDQRTPAIASDHNGANALAWGMNTMSDQQGVAVMLP